MNITINGSGNLVSQSVEASALTKLQEDRASYLLGTFRDSAHELVKLIEPRGKNSWLMIDRKLNQIAQSDHKTKHYYDLIAENFEIGTMYSLPEIIAIIADVRRDYGLPAYLTRIQANCEQDFLTVFIADDVFEDIKINSDGRKQHINFLGYVPTFKLIP